MDKGSNFIMDKPFILLYVLMNSNKSAKCQTHYPYRRRCVVYGSIIHMCHIASMGAKNT